MLNAQGRFDKQLKESAVTFNKKVMHEFHESPGEGRVPILIKCEMCEDPMKYIESYLMRGHHICRSCYKALGGK